MGDRFSPDSLPQQKPSRQNNDDEMHDNDGMHDDSHDDDDDEDIHDDDDEIHDDEMQGGNSSSSKDVTGEQQAVDDRDVTAFAARTKMQHRANYLVRQVELIETAKTEGRFQLDKFADAAANNDSSSRRSSDCLAEAIPPRLLAVSFDAKTTTSNYASSYNEDNWIYDSTEFEDTTIGRMPPALADDLSSYDGSPIAAAAGDSKGSQSRRIQELEAENRHLRDAVKKCCNAALNIQTNADLKIVRLEFEVAHLRQQLADELATNSKVMVLNQSLRKQLNQAASDIIQTKNSGSGTDKKRYCEFMQLHQRELTVEKHLNGLITSRNLAIKESTALKKLLLGTCYDCRQRLPLKRRTQLDESNKNAQAADEPDTVPAPTPPVVAQRPTYQSSARQLLDNLPHNKQQQQQQPHSSKQKPTTLTSPNHSPVGKKSCLKKSDEASSSITSGSTRISPTSTISLFSEEGLDLPSLPVSSPQTPTRKTLPKQKVNALVADDDTNSNESEHRLSPIRSFRRLDRRSDQGSSSLNRKQATMSSSTMTPPSTPPATQKKVFPAKSPTTKEGKEKNRWSRRSGGLFGTKSKREVERALKIEHYS